jgi:hypothetical protein
MAAKESITFDDGRASRHFLMEGDIIAMDLRVHCFNW